MEWLTNQEKKEGERKFFLGPRQECINEFISEEESSTSLRWHSCLQWHEFPSGGVQKPGLGFGNGLNFSCRPGRLCPILTPVLCWKGVQDGSVGMGRSCTLSRVWGRA